MEAGVERKRFPQISVRAIEHPTDRAALTAMRKVPGFDVAIKKLIGLLGERSLRTLFMASAVKVGERQFARIHAIYAECLEILDVGQAPELFVAQTPIVNAGAVGTDRPFIVLNSGLVAMLDDDELRYILGHELGHILSDHVLYKTMLNLLLRMTVVRFGVPLGWLAIWAIIAALTEWDRKSELSADRAGLLCAQDPGAVYRALMKLSGGGFAGELNLDAFIEQAEEYERGGDKLDSFYKLLNLLGQRHPFPVLRVSEAREWVEHGSYQTILAGDYAKRGQAEQARLYDELAATAKSYAKDYADSEDPLLRFFKDVGKGATRVGGDWIRKLRDQLKSGD